VKNVITIVNFVTIIYKMSFVFSNGLQFVSNLPSTVIESKTKTVKLTLFAL